VIQAVTLKWDDEVTLLEKKIPDLQRLGTKKRVTAWPSPGSDSSWWLNQPI